MISLLENHYQPSRINISISQNEIYDFEIQNPAYEPLLKTILRSYGGLFQEFIQIRENDLSERTNIPLTRIKEMLAFLDKSGIITYLASNDEPQIYFTIARQHPDRIPISVKSYEERSNAAFLRMQSMLNYVIENNQCRSTYLIKYFGENNARACGQCDVCLDQNKSDLVLAENNRILSRLQTILENEPMKPDQLSHLFSDDPAKFFEKMRVWLDEGILIENIDGSISWNYYE